MKSRLVKCLIALVLGSLFVAGAHASPGTRIASGLTQPKGAIRWNGSYFVSDTVQGFCRIDNGLLTPPGNAQTCFAAGTGSPELDGNLVYVTDNAGRTGVWRLTMDPINPVIQSAVNLVPNAGLGGNRPTAAILGPDGKLYVSFINNGDIVRITNPAADPTTQIVEQVGKSNSGKRVNSLTFVGRDLWMSQAGFMNRIGNATSCTGGCQAELIFGTIANQQGLIYDASRYLYFGNGAQVVQYDTTSSAQFLIYSHNGVITNPDQTTTLVAYALVWGLNRAPNGDLFIGDDPTVEAAGANGQGRLWLVAASAQTEGPLPNPPPGPPSPNPSPTPVPTALKTGSLYAAGFTRPNGLLFIGTHLWASDSSQGFCRIDVGTTSTSLSNCFKPSVNFVAGQASFDAATSMVYVPDSSANSTGIFRLGFNSVSETLGVAVNISQGNRPSAAIAGPDGSVYVSFLNNGTISKITTPATAPSAATKIGQSFSGGAVTNMVFIGNDLYLAEAQNVTVLIRASPSLTRGTAVVVGGATQKGQTPPLNVSGPLSLASDGISMLYVGSSGQVDQWSVIQSIDTIYASSGLIGTVNTPFKNVTGLTMGPGNVLYVGDDPTAGAQIGQGHVYQVK